ncbi:MAG: N-acetyltransferase [Candidatus Marinimicrobia bacterium]|nr:N-acetyltransferase [Candidatus Neomarinimicrobiota bacterium]
MKEISIRAETVSDYTAIRNLIVKVFHETYGSGEPEATLVEQLRQLPQPNTTISLIAELDQALVGQIFFSALQLENHPDIPVCALAPLGVYRQYQQQGIGSQLVEKGLEECAKQGYKAVFVQGSLRYYPRFGFIPLRADLYTIFKSDHDMVLELEKGIINKISGLVDYPEPWQALK